MTLTNLDANGIGRYDNPHNTVGLSFAGLLNAGLTSVSNGVRNLLNVDAAQTGLRVVVPTSVAGAGVTLNSTTGVITFVNATSVTLNGVFSAVAPDYLAIMRVTARSTPSFAVLRMVQAGFTLGTGYDVTRVVSSGTAVYLQIPNNTDIPLGANAATVQDCDIEIRRPFQLGQTGIAASITDVNVAAPPTAVQVFASTRQTAAYDGLSITPLAGTITGTLKVWARR